MIIEKAYAKINIMLHVISKNADGMHELESIMAPLSNLYDVLEFERNNTDDFVVTGFNCENNSVLNAAKLFQGTYKTKGANINIKKNIPVDAGLGGGSADSSATLRGLNKLFNLNISLEELSNLARKLGSDNVFCLYNTLSLCKGFGNEVEFINAKCSFNCLLIKPSFGFNTGMVFKVWDKNPISNKYDINFFNRALTSNNYKMINEIAFNDLFNSSLSLSYELEKLKEKIEKNNVKVFMTGSGSTLFIINENVNLLNDIKNQFDDCFTKICKIDSAIIEK